MDVRAAGRHRASANDGSSQAGGTTWARPAKGSTLSGLRDRVLTLSGASGRARQRWVAKATEGEREPVKTEDWRRIVAEVWESGESRWVLQRVRERPITTDHVVAFKALLLLHRVLQQGPPEVVSEWALPNQVIEGLATHWGASMRVTQISPKRHCIQAVAEYARVLIAKMELMAERDTGKGRFDGNIAVFDRSRTEPSDLLQSLAVLLDFAEKLMPFALHLVAPSTELWRMETSHYIRLYISAILAVLDEAWLLLCAVSLFVKDLLCQVHVARKIEQHGRARHGHHPAAAAAAGGNSPWLQLALHLLAAQPRFTWFHASVCDFVAHCHQLRCAGFIELAPHIPAVPQSLLNLFADLGELVRGQQAEFRATAAACGVGHVSGSFAPGAAAGQAATKAQREGSLASLSTAAGSTPQATECSHTESAPGGHSFKITPESGAQAPQLFDAPDVHAGLYAAVWEPSPQVLDALRTVDSIQNAPWRHSSQRGEPFAITNGASPGSVADGGVPVVGANQSTLGPPPPAASGGYRRSGSGLNGVGGGSAVAPAIDEPAAAAAGRGAGAPTGATSRNRSAPAAGRQGSAVSPCGGSVRCRQGSKEMQLQQRARHTSPVRERPRGSAGYMLLDEDHSGQSGDTSDNQEMDMQEGGSLSSTGRRPMGSEQRSVSPPGFKRAGLTEPRRPPAVAALIGATGGGPVWDMDPASSRPCPWASENGMALEREATNGSQEAVPPWPPPPIQLGPCGNWPPIVDSRLPSRATFTDAGCNGSTSPPSWASAICRSNNARSEGHTQPLFVAPLWQVDSQQQGSGSFEGVASQGALPVKRASSSFGGVVQGGEYGEQVVTQGLNSPVLPLNPFDLTATQLQRAVLRKDSRADLGCGGGGYGGGATPQQHDGGSPPASGLPPPLPHGRSSPTNGAAASQAPALADGEEGAAFGQLQAAGQPAQLPLGGPVPQQPHQRPAPPWLAPAGGASPVGSVRVSSGAQPGAVGSPVRSRGLHASSPRGGRGGTSPFKGSGLAVAPGQGPMLPLAHISRQPAHQAQAPPPVPAQQPPQTQQQLARGTPHAGLRFGSPMMGEPGPATGSGALQPASAGASTPAGSVAAAAVANVNAAVGAAGPGAGAVASGVQRVSPGKERARSPTSQQSPSASGTAAQQGPRPNPGANLGHPRPSPGLRLLGPSPRACPSGGAAAGPPPNPCGGSQAVPMGRTPLQLQPQQPQDGMPPPAPVVHHGAEATPEDGALTDAGARPAFGPGAPSPHPVQQPQVGPPPRQVNLAAPAAENNNDWEVDPAELRLEEMLGTGSTAEVFRGSWHGTDVAVKRLRRSGPLSVEFTREISVLLRLRHPNLVLFMGAAVQAPTPLIISEFCAGGTVFALLHQRRDLALPWPQRVKVAIDVAKGMNFLHRRQVVHRDLKSLNLLLASRVNTDKDVPLVKVSDFGLSRTWLSNAADPPHQACMTSGAGTYHWMAPEVLDGQTYDEKVDVYSYGICLFEIIARRIPYEGSGLEPVSIAVAVSKGRRPDLRHTPQDCPADLRFTMECCWAHCATGRPGFDTILETLKLVNCP